MKKHYLLFILLTIFSVVGCSNKGETQENIDPNTPDYPQNYIGFSDIKYKDFTFRVNNIIFNESDANSSIEFLKAKIDTIYTLIDISYIKKICKNPIWVEKNINNGGAWYNPSYDWLKENNMITAKAKCVEITNYKHFVAWMKLNQPYSLFHELCHLYHDQVLGFDYPLIIEAYNHANDSGMYRNISYFSGNGIYIKKDKAYALTNHKEYFTETCEAFFGFNDYYPHNNAQLKDYDPQMYQILKNIWGK
ncbi:MAG: hypothetical protein WC140_04065 [Bacteroidales bacterium]